MNSVIFYRALAQRGRGAGILRRLAFCCAALVLLSAGLPCVGQDASTQAEEFSGPDWAPMQTIEPLAAEAGSEAPAGSDSIEIKPESSASGGDTLKVTTLSPGGYLHYDQERGTIYSPERTRIEYQGVVLIADTVDFNQRVMEITAAGNVVLQRGDEGEIRADRVRYNFEKDEGVAFQAKGSYGPVHFEPSTTEDEQTPTVQRLSEEEMLLRKAAATGCDFVIPHYRIRAREIIFYPNDRVFFRSATLFVRGLPVFYFPFFAHSLRESSPWYTSLGYKSRLGAWARLGYVYKHETQVPSALDGDKLETVSEGRLKVFADYLTKRGPGAGASYEYMFDRDRHRGVMDFYYLHDGNRDVEEEPTLERYQALVKHRSQLTDDLTWLLNTDWHSDPETYDEILDIFRADSRKRTIERSAQTALTWTKEQYLIRMMIGVKDRIGRDRITDFSDPYDADRDFDVQPELDVDDRDDEGLPTDRWGRVSTRLPHLTVETLWLRLWNLPIYYHSDLNIFNNLDKGLNTVDRDDDSYVQGFDWYNALLWRWRLSQRLTALTQVGAGAGMARRADDDFGYGEDDAAGLDLDDGGDTLRIGDEEFRLGQVQSGFVYGDFQERIKARFSDALTGDLIYRYRAATDDFLGDWYAQMGNHWVRSDLYNFRLRENNIEGILRYVLLHPRLSASLRAFRNLVSEGERYPQELVSSYGGNLAWQNAAGTLLLAPSIGWSERQVYHPSDERAYVNSGFDYGLAMRYSPLSKLWWTKWSYSYHQNLRRNLDDSDKYEYREDEGRTAFSGLIGGRVGPKWTSELYSRWDSRSNGFREVRLTLKRDLHDALLLMMIGLEENVYKSDSRDSGGFLGSQVDLRFAFQPKLPQGELAEGIPAITTLDDRMKAPEIEVPEEELRTYQRY